VLVIVIVLVLVLVIVIVIVIVISDQSRVTHELTLPFGFRSGPEPVERHRFNASAQLKQRFPLPRYQAPGY
jgi:NADH:ubiquinone oxidoreductase subunit 3 (subunit A)